MPPKKWAIKVQQFFTPTKPLGHQFFLHQPTQNEEHMMRNEQQMWKNDEHMTKNEQT